MTRRVLSTIALCLVHALIWGQSLDLKIDFERTSIESGSSVSTRIWVINTSGQTAENTVVTVTLPEQTRVWMGSVFPAGSPSSGYVNASETATFELGDLASGSVKAIQLPLLVVNAAVVGESTTLEADSNYSEPISKDLTLVEPEALQIALTADRQAVSPGDLVALTVHIANPGDTGAARTNLRLELPPELEIVTSTLPASSISNGSVDLDLGTVPGGSLSQHLLLVRLSGSAATPALFHVTGEVEPRTSDMTAHAELQILSLETLPAGITVENGEPQTVLLHNYAGSRLEDGVLYVDMPREGRVWAGNVQPLATDIASGYVNPGDAPLHWELPDIFSGDPFIVQIPVDSTADNAYARVQRNLLETGSVTLPADRPWTHGVYEGGELRLYLSGPEPIDRSDTFSLKIHYGNLADSEAENLVLYLHLPDSVTVLHSTLPWNDLGDGLFSADLGDLRPGESDLQWVSLQAGDDLPETYQHDFKAWVMDESLSMKSGMARFAAQAYENFPAEVKFNTNKLMHNASGPFFTDLEITNHSASPLTDLRVALNVPWNVRFWTGYSVPVPDTGSGYVTRQDKAVWDIPALGAGERTVISIPWNFTQNLDGYWQGIQAVLTTTEGYNTRSRVAATTSNPNHLRLHIQPETSAVRPGDPVWLTLTYANHGTTSALNPGITVQLPHGVTFLDSDIEPVQTEPVLLFNVSSMNGGDRGRFRILVDTDDDHLPGNDTTILARIRDESVPFNSSAAQASLVLEQPGPLKLEITGHRDPMNGRVWQVEAVLNNTSTTALENVRLWFNVPEGLNIDPDHVQPFGGSGSGLSGNLPYEYTIETLPPGEPYLISLPFLPANSQPAGWIAPITVHAETGDGYHVRDVEHMVYDTGDLRLEIQPMSDFAYAGQNLTYRIYVGNTATENRENVILRANIPLQTSFVSAGSGGIAENQMIRWDVGTIAAGHVAYVEATVAVPGSVPSGTLFQTEAYVTDSESPRNSARAVTSIPAIQGQPTLNMDVAYEDDILSYQFTNNLGGELASARFWFTLPRYARIASDTGINEREPFIWDLLNVVSDEPQVFSDEIVPTASPQTGHLYPFTAGVQSNLRFGAFRRFVLPFSDTVYEVAASGLDPAILQMWTDAERRAEVWVRSAWYGWFLDEAWPWIIHAEHGYQYPIYTEFGLYLFDFPLGTWLFTNQSLYFTDPNFGNLFFYDGAEWAPIGFYRGGVSPNRWFYHFGPGFDRAVNEAELRTLVDFEQ